MERKEQIEQKENELCQLDWKSFIDRVCGYPDQRHLDFQDSGVARKFQVGNTAQGIREKGYPSIPDRQYARMVKAFAHMTITESRVQMTGPMPEGFYGTGYDGHRIGFGLMEEGPGKVAVYVPLKTGECTRIGYLEHPPERIGTRIAAGRYEKGRIEIPLDTEELFHMDKDAPSQGPWQYQKDFAVNNVPEGMVPVFEVAMDQFPVKEILNGLMEKKGWEPCVTDVSWHINGQGGEDGAIVKTSQKLGAPQMLFMDQALEYLAVESDYGQNRDNRYLSDFMPQDNGFARRVKEVFREQGIGDWAPCEAFSGIQNACLKEQRDGGMSMGEDFARAVAELQSQQEKLSLS